MWVRVWVRLGISMGWKMELGMEDRDGDVKISYRRERRLTFRHGMKRGWD